LCCDLPLNTDSVSATTSYSRRINNPPRTPISVLWPQRELEFNLQSPSSARSICTPSAVVLVVFVSSNVDGNYDINVITRQCACIGAIKYEIFIFLYYYYSHRVILNTYDLNPAPWEIVRVLTPRRDRNKLSMGFVV